MLVKQVLKSEIATQMSQFGHHISYFFDRLEYGDMKATIDLDTLNEGFYFNEQGCLHVYRNPEVMGILMTYEETDDYYDEKQIGPDQTNLKSLVIRKVLAEDEDGQIFVQYVLPYQLIKKGE